MDHPSSVSEPQWFVMEAERLGVRLDAGEALRVTRNREAVELAQVRLIREIAARRR